MAPELYVIAAGSLLESAIDSHISFPVGRVEYLAVRPCSFQEFLIAMNEIRSLEVLSEFPFPVYAHDKLMDLFRLYTLLGGMPAVVDKYSKTRDIVSLAVLFDSLINSFLDDIEKYSRNQSMARVIRHVMEQSFYFTGSRITFQGFGKSNYKSREVGEAFRMIEKAMLLQLVYPTTTVIPPLIPDQRKSPKLHFVDVGLINYRCGLQKELFGTTAIDAIYQGRIAEQIVAQELLSLNTSVSAKNHFWVREKHQSSAEVDFIYPYREYLIPVEVKAGKAGMLRSIHQFIHRSPHPYAVRVYSGKLSVDHLRTPYGTNYMLLNLPFYLVHKMDDYLEWFIDEQFLSTTVSTQ
jgi:predicted AAA+ superfamily ATPase